MIENTQNPLLKNFEKFSVYQFQTILNDLRVARDKKMFDKKFPFELKKKYIDLRKSSSKYQINLFSHHLIACDEKCIL